MTTTPEDAAEMFQRCPKCGASTEDECRCVKFPSAVVSLSKILDGVPVRIGLRQQGHLSTVERMRAEGATWDEIGKAIGWHGPTVAKWYEFETRNCNVLLKGE